MEVDKLLEIGQVFKPEDRNDYDSNEFNISDWANYGFSRDLSRIVFSNSFKRMSGKTQIFPPSFSDHLMSRLTHTIIVNNIAMDISYRLNRKYNTNINIELVQAIANGHDVGHTPFGHAGERIIKKCFSKNNDECVNMQLNFSDEYYFKHNIFSVYILQNLDRIKNISVGYDLAWQTIDGILKHTEVNYLKKYQESLQYIINNKFLTSNLLLKTLKSYNKDIESYFEYLYPITIEGQIVKAADEIAQYYHDVLDLARYINTTDIVENFISKIFEINNLEKNNYVEKFINTFTSKENNKRKMNDKITILDNKEFFCSELKELFINDIVINIASKIEKSNIKNFLCDNSGRFIVDNVLFFTDEQNKVRLCFYSDYVKHVANILVKFRDGQLKKKEIEEYDNYGVSVIQETLTTFLNNYKVFEKYCSKDLIECLRRYLKINGGSININQNEINHNNIDKYRGLVIKFLYQNYIVKNESFEYKKEINDIIYSCIIMTIAKMTDNFMLKRKYLD